MSETDKLEDKHSGSGSELSGLVSCCHELIDILLNSCTCYAGEVEYHEHNLFDNVDRDRLEDIQKQLKKIEDRQPIDDSNFDTADS